MGRISQQHRLSEGRGKSRLSVSGFGSLAALELASNPVLSDQEDMMTLRVVQGNVGGDPIQEVWATRTGEIQSQEWWCHGSGDSDPSQQQESWNRIWGPNTIIF